MYSHNGWDKAHPVKPVSKTAMIGLSITNLLLLPFSEVLVVNAYSSNLKVVILQFNTVSLTSFIKPLSLILTIECKHTTCGVNVSNPCTSPPNLIRIYYIK
jgi:hypothetical protein